MRPRSSKSSSPRVAAFAYGLAVAALVLVPRAAAAQACCAGSGAVTPGRLGMHEDALVALQARAAHVFGSFDGYGNYATPRSGDSEQDFEQDAIGALRLPGVASRGQLALLVPLVETRRSAKGLSESGGGLGDANFSGRYDFLYAGQNRYVPGIAFLAGLTFPTGRPPEDAGRPLATAATGIGAFQGNVGLSAEQLFGSFLVTAYGIVAKRAARTANGVSTTLGTQWTALLAVAYSLPRDCAVAVSGSYTGEGNAEVGGVEASRSSRRIPILGVSGVVPLSDHFRFQGGFSGNPPIPELGKNQIANLAFSITGLYAWY